MALKPITVSQLNDYISRIVGRDPLLSSVLVKGEVSGVKYHGSGYVFFSLLDDYLAKSAALCLRRQPEP